MKDLLIALTPLDNIIENRLLIMQENGYVKKEGEKYSLTGKGKLFAWLTMASTYICASQLQSERTSIPF